jgi:multidrug efflux system membrane fusion protein
MTAQTQHALAGSELARAQKLIKSGFATKELLDQRANAKRMADAAIKSAEADVRQATINLDYAYLKAPIDGRVGRAAAYNHCFQCQYLCGF